MKVVFLVFAILFIFITPAFPLSFTQSSTGVIEIKGMNFLGRAARNGILVKTPSFNFGSIEDGGIIALLDNPHASYTLVPYFSLSAEDKTLGSGLSFSHFSLFSFLGDRDGLGLQYKTGTFSLTFIYAGKAEDDDIQKEAVLRRDRSSLWGIASYIWNGKLSLRAMASLSSFSSLSLFFRSSLKFSVFTLTFSSGRVEAFSSKSKNWQNHYSLKIKTPSFEGEHKLSMGRDPIYVYEYRDYDFSFKGRLTLGVFSLSSSVDKRFIEGKESRKEEITLSIYDISIGYRDEKKTFFVRYEKNGLKVEYEKGKMTLDYSFVLETEDVTMTYSISSEKTLNWSIKYEK